MVEVAAPVGDRCGEGAVWSALERAVWWTDINRFLVHRFDEDSSSTRSWLFDEPVVGLSLTTEPGRMLVILASKLIWWWPATDRRQDHGFKLEGSPRVRLNDGRTDPMGNLWVGSMKNNVLPDGELGEPGPGEGKLFRIAPDGSITVWAEGLGISNTLCWSPDRKTFYFGDTSTTSSGPSTTTQARSPTAATTSVAGTGVCPTARPSTLPEISGTAASAAAASRGLVRTAHLKAPSRSESRTSPPAFSAARTCALSSLPAPPSSPRRGIGWRVASSAHA